MVGGRSVKKSYSWTQHPQHVLSGGWTWWMRGGGLFSTIQGVAFISPRELCPRFGISVLLPLGFLQKPSEFSWWLQARGLEPRGLTIRSGGCFSITKSRGLAFQDSSSNSCQKTWECLKVEIWSLGVAPRSGCVQSFFARFWYTRGGHFQTPKCGVGFYKINKNGAGYFHKISNFQNKIFRTFRMNSY